MRYEDFKDRFTHGIEQLLEGTGIEVLPQEMTKVNQRLDALSFRPEGKSMGAVLYLKDFYEKYEDGADLYSLTREAEEVISDRIRNVPDMPPFSHEYILNHLYLTVVNAKMNQDYLSSIPFEKMEDLAIVPRVKVNEDASFALQTWMMDTYGFERAELFEAARSNMDNQEYICRDLGSVLLGYGVPDDMTYTPSESVYVLTNTSGIDGAAAILSEKAMKDAREMIGEDFLILPSSRHEVLLVPRSTSFSIRDLSDMVKEVNASVVDREDLLSDHVYRYNSKAGSIRMLEPGKEALEKVQSLPPVL